MTQSRHVADSLRVLEQGVVHTKSANLTACAFHFSFWPVPGIAHTHSENMRPVRKRRIRFLTDAKIGVFSISGVVDFVVFAVVLHVVGA